MSQPLGQFAPSANLSKKPYLGFSPETKTQLENRHNRIQEIGQKWMSREYPAADFQRYNREMAQYRSLPEAQRAQINPPELQFKHDIPDRKSQGVSSNIVLKIVGDTGTSYKVPSPDLARYEYEWKQYQNLLPAQRAQTPSPILHYTASHEIRMSKHQRNLQRQGKLPGCIANCSVPPIGSVDPKWRRGKMMGTTFPDADEVMRRFTN